MRARYGPDLAPAASFSSHMAQKNPIWRRAALPLSIVIRRWLWLTVSAVAAFAVLVWLDLRLKAATGAGGVDLQGADTALAYKTVFSAWIARQHAAMAGFALGFDYLFMPLYGFAFYYSAILAREAFA